MEGNLVWTFLRTADFSSAVPCWDTRESAFRAWLASSIGYRLPGSANDVDGSALRVAAFSFAMSDLSQKT